MSDLHPNFRLWIYGDNRPGVFGDGKVRLLKAVARTSSLREAAQTLGISYRKAWGDLKKAEACLKRQLIERVRGGRGGGHTTLTDDGRRVLAAYECFRDRARQHLEREFAKMLKGITW